MPGTNIDILWMLSAAKTRGLGTSEEIHRYGLTVTMAAVGPDDGDEMFPDVAVMIVVCGDVKVVTAVNKPLLSIVPALVLEEAHVALEVMSSVVPFEVVAIALSCAVPPTLMLVFVGVTAIDVMFPS